MRVGVALCVSLLFVSMLSGLLPVVTAPDQDYLAYHDSIGFVARVFDGSSTTYTKYGGDPNLLREYQPGDLPDYEYRGFWRFTIPDFTDKNVKDVKLEFRTRNAQCLPLPTCDGALSFKVDLYRLYADPATATPQQIFDGIHEFRGLPYLKGSLGELTLQAQTTYPKSLGPNAVADLNHHEGSWYAIGMKIFEVRDTPNDLVWGMLELCSLSDCSYPPPGPGTQFSKPGPVPLYAVPVLKITYADETAWSQLHGDARHNGYSPALAPRSGLGVWRAQECDPSTCHHTGYSPVAKDGYVYTVVVNSANTALRDIRALDYGGNLVASRSVPEVTNIPGFHSLAVDKEMVVYTGTQQLPTWHTFVRAFSPAPALTPLWSYTISGNSPFNYAAPTLYGRYVLVGTAGYVNTGGQLRLLEGRDSTVTSVWTFSLSTGEHIFAPPAIYKDWVLVRSTTKLYAIPLVDPNGNGVIAANEVRWTFDLGAWGGGPYDRALNSGPAVKGGYVYIGSHAGNVYKIPIESPNPPTPVWTYSAGPGYYMPPTPGIGFGYVYVIVVANSGTPTYVRAINDGDGSLQFSRQYDNANTGRGSPSLADGKVFLWIGSIPPGGSVPAGAWTIILNWDLSLELFWVPTGNGYDGEYGGNTPAIASSSPALLDSWVFVGSGFLSFQPSPDPWGYVMGWNQ